MTLITLRKIINDYNKGSDDWKVEKIDYYGWRPIFNLISKKTGEIFQELWFEVFLFDEKFYFFELMFGPDYMVIKSSCCHCISWERETFLCASYNRKSFKKYVLNHKQEGYK